jgi:ankyrin repeat protein
VFKAIVDAKADIASRGPDFETPLMRAANHHNVDGVRALIAAKADVNDVMIDGYTALAMAASEGSLESVSALIAAGANVNHASRGVTAIIMAVQDNHPSVLKALIAAKADVNTTYNQRTMLDIATMQGRGLIVKILKDSGAVTYKQMMGNNKLLTAVLANDLDAVDVLVDSANDLERDSALIAAVNKGFFAIVECMLDAGADPCAVQSQSSVLSIACSLGRADIARILIEADADVGAKDGNGKTAMQIAAQHKHRDIVSMLMAKTNELKRANKC